MNEDKSGIEHFIQNLFYKTTTFFTMPPLVNQLLLHPWQGLRVLGGGSIYHNKQLLFSCHVPKMSLSSSRLYLEDGVVKDRRFLK